MRKTRTRIAACIAVGVALAVCTLGSFAPGIQAASAPTSVGVADAATPTPLPLASKLNPPRKNAFIGIFRPPAPYKPSAIDGYKSLARKPASLVMWYQLWSTKAANRFDTAMAVAVWKRGAIPVISWEPWDPGTSPVAARTASEWSLAKIISGKYDDYITQYADDVRDAGGPVMISLMHEMNGVWYPWGGTVNGNSPAQFITAWRHVHDIFTREGATNVTWVWSVNLRSRPDTYANRWAAYYPGNAYVDWVGVSGFNWGVGVGGWPWWSFEQMLGPPLKYLKATHKPVIITETASVEQGGSKAAWIRATFARIRSAHPEIKAVLWFDSKEFSHGHYQDWRINSSRSSLAAYRSAIKPPYYWGSTPPTLAAWRATITPTQWSDLLATRWIY
jgi:mannan endo-1,4-beta-mannosidase